MINYNDIMQTIKEQTNGNLEYVKLGLGINPTEVLFIDMHIILGNLLKYSGKSNKEDKLGKNSINNIAKEMAEHKEDAWRYLNYSVASALSKLLDRNLTYERSSTKAPWHLILAWKHEKDVGLPQVSKDYDDLSKEYTIEQDDQGEYSEQETEEEQISVLDSVLQKFQEAGCYIESKNVETIKKEGMVFCEQLGLTNLESKKLMLLLDKLDNDDLI